MNRDRKARRFGALSAVAILAPCLALGLAACSQPLDPEETIESLTSVTEAPAAPDAAALEEYDFELHPDPIVEALDCTPYLIVTARGTAEPRQKNQLLSPVAREITKALPEQVATLDLDYPADTDVNVGGTRGARVLLDTLNVQSEACPEQRFVLLGYSQGALVIGDVLAEPASRLVGVAAGEISEAAAERVIAVVFYGNPRFSGAEQYAVGSYDAALSGILPREESSLDAFAERIRDFCVKADFICQSSMSLDERGHVAYFKNGMQQDGAEFVLERIAALSAGEPRAEAPSDQAEAGIEALE